MATTAQIEANRRNAQKSTGPKTEEGKARSRENALKHGMTGEGKVLPERVEQTKRGYEECLARQIRPRTTQQVFLISQAAIAMSRMQHLPTVEDIMRKRASVRAESNWEQDRCDEASKIGDGLLKRPTKAFRELQRTPQGVDWMLGQWQILLAALADAGVWSDEQKQRAGALLGIPLELQPFEFRIRNLKTVEACRTLAEEELERLLMYRLQVLTELDAHERILAIQGVLFDISPQAWRLRRYEQANFKKLLWAEAELEKIEAASGGLLWNGAPDGGGCSASAVSDAQNDINRGADRAVFADQTPVSAPAPQASQAASDADSSAARPASPSAQAETPKRSRSTQQLLEQDLETLLREANDPMGGVFGNPNPPPPVEPVKKGLSRREKRRARREAERRAAAQPR